MSLWHKFRQFDIESTSFRPFISRWVALSKAYRQSLSHNSHAALAVLVSNTGFRRLIISFSVLLDPTMRFAALSSDLLKKSAPSRVVFVSSLMHWLWADLDADDLFHERMLPYNNAVAYANTKLCNVLTAAHLSRLLKDTGAFPQASGQPQASGYGNGNSYESGRADPCVHACKRRRADVNITSPNENRTWVESS